MKPHQISRKGSGGPSRSSGLSRTLMWRPTCWWPWGSGSILLSGSLPRPTASRRSLGRRWVISKMPGIRPFIKHLAKNLPLGIKKRLEIARALALRPRLLLLDEPSAGLRYEEATQLMDLIRKVCAQGSGFC